MLFWQVPAPDQALLISGSKHEPADTPLRVVIGRGSFVWPVTQKARTLSLGLREAKIVEDCVTNQGVRLNVRAVVAFKVGDDRASIAKAARCFLSQQDRMEEIVGRAFAGHLLSAVGKLSVEQIITERDRIAQEIHENSRAEMDKLGIAVIALEIQQIEDTSGYISNLAAPHAATVASQARIAQANADLEASEREREVADLNAQYERDLEIKRAGYLAEAQQAKAEAEQAGPLTEARIAQEVIEQQAALAQRQADLAAQRLEAEVRQPADAEAYRIRALAEAERDREKLAADAEAYRMITVAQAEAQAAKINGDVATYPEQDQGRRGRLRQRRLGEPARAEQPAASRG